MQNVVSETHPDAGGIESPPTTASKAAGKLDQFDEKKLETLSVKSKLIEYVARYPQRLIGALRRFRPLLVVRIPFVRWAFVFRYDEVREVLAHDQEFPVGWGRRMVEVTQGKNFVLGMPRDEEYQLSYKQLAEAFPRADVPKYVVSQAAAATAAILAGKVGGPGFDAVEALITAVPTHLCESYFGIRIPDKVLFAKWTLAISSYLFGPTPGKADRALGLAAAACLRKEIRDSTTTANGNPHQGIVLPRMIAMQIKDPQVTDDVIHAQLFGMVLGFIPTNVLAGGNILETLLHRPEFLKRARAAALAGDDDLLWRCLRETLRFRHINLGPWRTCPNGYTFGEGGPCPIKVPPGYKVLAMFQSAMFDSRQVERPHSFDPDRRDEDYMVFGIGQHWCLGAYIATAQLTQTFKLLLAEGNLRRADGKPGHMKRFSIFPLHLHVRLEPES